MNLLTFDIEEWYIEEVRCGGRSKMYEMYDNLLDHLLITLSTYNVKATFFCLGKIAEDFPHIVRRIADCGHEIGSHSHVHKWINKMTPEQFREDTHASICALENVIGRKVVSFRAPAFSIGENNKWAFEILAEQGIENDASVFPGERDFGGFPSFTLDRPCQISYNGITINEFPIPLYRVPVVGKSVAYSGGGYFRLLPYGFVKYCIDKSDYTMCYFHMQDFLSEKSKLMTRREYEDYFKENGSFKNRLLRYVKSNIGRDRALVGYDKMVASYPFISIKAYLESYKVENIVSI